MTSRLTMLRSLLYRDVRCSLLVTLTRIALVLAPLQSSPGISALTHSTKIRPLNSEYMVIGFDISTDASRVTPCKPSYMQSRPLMILVQCSLTVHNHPVSLPHPAQRHATQLPLHTFPRLQYPPIRRDEHALSRPRQTLHIARLSCPRNLSQILARQPYPPCGLGYQLHILQDRLVLPVLQAEP